MKEPLVKGGQGKTAEEVQDSAFISLFCILGAIILLIISLF